MKVWSRGLGKQALNADWYKTDLSVDGRALLAKGIVRDKGIIWDCQFTFTIDDLPGLLYMLTAYPVMRHFLSNIKYVLTFGYVRLVKKGATKEKAREKPKEKPQEKPKSGS
jgi:hypothetical protein